MLLSRGKLIKLASTWGVSGLDAQLAELDQVRVRHRGEYQGRDADRIEAAKQIVEFQPDSEPRPRPSSWTRSRRRPGRARQRDLESPQSKAKSLGTAVVARLKDRRWP
ncbi:MAG: hypothetical protein U0791_12225 [Gemmataceae bacterium]